MAENGILLPTDWLLAATNGNHGLSVMDFTTLHQQ